MLALLKRRSTKIVLVVVVVVVAAYWFLNPAPPPFRGSGEPMTAVVYDRYGPADVLRVQEVEKPLPNDNQVLIKVRAAAANPLDWHYMRGTPYIMRLMGPGFSKPKIQRLGVDVAGEVVAVGSGVTDFKVGDEVFGIGRGSFAEYVRASAKRVALKPANISFEQAAGVPVAGITALQGLRDKGKVHAGQKVLINGASGGVGTFAVQIAKAFGADVTGVCSTRNVELVRSIGADHVLDYTKEDFTKGTERYDVVYDTVGNHSMPELRRVLNAKGIAVMIGGGGPGEGNWVGALVQPIKALFYSPFISQKFVFFLADVTRDDLTVLRDLIEAGKVKPVVDTTYPLSRTAEAMQYLERGHARGKVVVAVAGDKSQKAMK
jgi:NADPH:quinone reductase-like Zn-dependent oxidoreductase